MFFYFFPMFLRIIFYYKLEYFLNDVFESQIIVLLLYEKSSKYIFSPIFKQVFFYVNKLIYFSLTCFRSKKEFSK